MPHNQTNEWYSMSAKGKVADISIYEQIGSSFFSDGVTSKSFEKDLKALGDVSTINLSINSPGGSVFHGVAIYNMLKSHSARVVVTVNGIAASIASFIAMAGDEIIMPENAMMMIHNPSTMTFNESNAEALRKKADLLDKITESLSSTYARRSGQEKSKIIDMMNKETWMTADEAKNLGFTDSVSEPSDMAAMFSSMRDYKNTPWEAIASRCQSSFVGDKPKQKKEQTPMPDANASEIKMSQEQLDELIAKAVNAKVGPEIQRINEMRAQQISSRFDELVASSKLTPAQRRLMESITDQLSNSCETMSWSLEEDGSNKKTGTPVDAVFALASTMSHTFLSEQVAASDEDKTKIAAKNWKPDMSGMDSIFTGCEDSYVMDQYINSVLKPQHPTASYKELVAMALKDEALTEILKQY